MRSLDGSTFSNSRAMESATAQGAVFCFSVVLIMFFIILVLIYHYRGFNALLKYYFLSLIALSVVFLILKPKNFGQELEYRESTAIPIAVYASSILFGIGVGTLYARHHDAEYRAYLDDVIDHMRPTMQEWRRAKAKMGVPEWSSSYNDIENIFSSGATTNYKALSIRAQWVADKRLDLYDPFECILMCLFHKPGRHPRPWLNENKS